MPKSNRMNNSKIQQQREQQNTAANRISKTKSLKGQLSKKKRDVIVADRFNKSSSKIITSIEPEQVEARLENFITTQQAEFTIKDTVEKCEEPKLDKPTSGLMLLKPLEYKNSEQRILSPVGRYNSRAIKKSSIKDCNSTTTQRYFSQNANLSESHTIGDISTKIRGKSRQKQKAASIVGQNNDSLHSVEMVQTKGPYEATKTTNRDQLPQQFMVASQE